jgi:YebC/PmpR family DNA-binding regulatory protein
LTDNKNRTVSEVRHIFSKHGGNLGESGSVAWIFQRKGYIVVEQSRASEDELMDIILEAGAEDMTEDGSNYEILTSPEDYESVDKALKDRGIEMAVSTLSMVPQNYVKLEGRKAEQCLKLMDALEDQDDAQHVWANFDIDEEEISKYSEQ